MNDSSSFAKLIHAVVRGETVVVSRMVAKSPDLATMHSAAGATRQDTVKPMLASGLFLAGTASDVRDEFVRQWRELPAEYVVVIYHYAQQPKDSVIEELRQFMREVKPALDDVLRERWAGAAPAEAELRA